MSLKRYFQPVSSSADSTGQKKAKQSQVQCIYLFWLSPRNALILNSRTVPLDLPPLDNELLPLLDLSSPDISSQASVIERFDTISEHLFQRSYLVCCSTKADGSPKRVLYELLEFEFYLIKVDCHSDPFTHDGVDQRLSGAWSVPILCMMSDQPNKTFGLFQVLPSRTAAQRLGYLRSPRLPQWLSERTRLDHRDAQLP